MPPLGRGNRSVRTERVLRRRRRSSTPTSRAHAQERYYASQGRQISTQAKRQRRAAARRPTPIAFRPLAKNTAPFKVQRQRARRKAERADRKIPDSTAIPHIPLLRRYSKPQQEIIRRTYKAAAKRAGTSPDGLYLLGSQRQRQQIRRVVQRVHESERPVPAYRQIEYHSPPARKGGFSGFATLATGELTRRLKPPNEGSFANALQLTKPIQAVGVGAFNLGRATVEDPAAVASASFRTAKESIFGIPQGAKMIATAAEKAVVHGDTSDLGKVLHQIGADYERRYGSILSDPKKFREMVKKDYGLTPFLLDATAAVGGSGAAAGAVARTGTFGRLASLPGVAGRAARVLHEASKVEKARPLLKYGGGRVGAREQNVSKNLFVALGQRKIDRSRRAAYVKRAKTHGYRVLPNGLLKPIEGKPQSVFSGLRPRPGEVVRKYDLRNRVPVLREMPGGIRRDIGGRQSTGRLRLLNLSHVREVKARKLLKHLSAPERDVGVWMMLRTGAKPGKSGVLALERRRANILAERKRAGYQVPDVLKATNDEVAVIDKILADPGKYLTSRARDAANQLRDMQIEDAQRVLPAQQEVLRRLQPQADLLGVPRNLKDGTPAPDVRALEHLAGALDDTAAIQRQMKNYTIGGKRVQIQGLSNQVQKVIDNIKSGKDPHVAGPDTPETIRDTASFIERTREAAAKADLEEPGYWQSGLLENLDPRGQFATGAGIRASELPGKQYTGVAHRLGVERQSADVFHAGQQRNLKRRVQHQMVVTNAEHYAYEWSLNGGKGRTIGELEAIARDNAIDVHSLAFIPARLLRHRGDEPSLGQAPGMVARGNEAAQAADAGMTEIHKEIQGRKTFDELMVGDRKALARERYLAYPAEVGDVLETATKPSMGWQRKLEWMLKTKPSRVMLGLNPPWLGIQILSNGAFAGIGGMSPLDIYGMLKFDRWLKKNDPEAHAYWEAEMGLTRGRHWQTDLGHTDTGTGRDIPFVSRMAAGIRAFSHTKTGRVARMSNAPSRLMDTMFGADVAQTAFFRKALWYSAAKKDARKHLGEAISGAAKAQSKIEKILRLPPNDAVKAIAENQALFERHAKHVDKWLGNYVKFSHAERRVLAANLVFYGWLRHSLRLTFYTVPIQHPIMANIMGNIGRLGAQDIKDLFGVPSNYDLPMAAMANIYSGYDTQAEGRAQAKAGTLKASNFFARASPFGNTVTQADSPAQLTGLVSPFLQMVAEQLFQESAFTGRDWRISGRSTPPKHSKGYYGSGWGAFLPSIPGVTQGRPRGRILENSVLNLTFPYRALRAATMQPSQTDDALPWLQLPISYTEAGAKAGVAKSRREWRGKGPGGALKESLLPFQPRITLLPSVVQTDRELRANEKNRRLGKKKRKRKGFGGGGFSGGGFGGSGSSGGFH